MNFLTETIYIGSIFQMHKTFLLRQLHINLSFYEEVKRVICGNIAHVLFVPLGVREKYSIVMVSETWRSACKY